LTKEIETNSYSDDDYNNLSVPNYAQTFNKNAINIKKKRRKYKEPLIIDHANKWNSLQNRNVTIEYEKKPNLS